MGESHGVGTGPGGLAAAAGFPGTDAADTDGGFGGAGFAGDGAEDGDLFSSGIAQNAPTPGEQDSERTLTFISLGWRCQRRTSQCENVDLRREIGVRS